VVLKQKNSMIQFGKRKTTFKIVLNCSSQCIFAQTYDSTCDLWQWYIETAFSS